MHASTLPTPRCPSCGTPSGYTVEYARRQAAKELALSFFIGQASIFVLVLIWLRSILDGAAQ